MPDSDTGDRGEDAGVALLLAADELGDVAFTREGLELESAVAADVPRSADPDPDEAVLPPEAGAFGIGPTTGGIPNPAGETGLPAAEEVAAPDVPEAVVDAAANEPGVAAPGADDREPDEEPALGPEIDDGEAVRGAGAEDTPPRADVVAPAADAPGRGVDTDDAAPDDVGADAPLPAESVSTGPSGSNN